MLNMLVYHSIEYFNQFKGFKWSFFQLGDPITLSIQFKKLIFTLFPNIIISYKPSQMCSLLLA